MMGNLQDETRHQRAVFKRVFEPTGKNSCRVNVGARQGCQIFLGTKYQNGKNIPNYHELCQMPIKYNKRP
jgi:hypothetical protein